jgi:hypothetical protein
MHDVEPSTPSAPSPVFQLWIIQWRMGILDPREAAFVLRLVLHDLRTKRADDPFWKFLRQFLTPSVADTETSLPEDAVEVERLLHCAWFLQPRQAKLLLEHLSQCYALNGDDLQFWRAVSEAIELHDVVPREPVRPGSC